MLKRTTLSWTLLVALTALSCGDDDKPNPDDGDDDDGGQMRNDAGLDAARGDGSIPGADSGSDSAKPNPAQPDGSQPDSSQPGSNDAGIDGGGPVLTVCDASKAPVLPALKLEPVPGVGDLARLVDAEQPKGTADWYLVQQSGTVRILRNGRLLQGAFVDVTSEIAIGNDQEERGLLGIAFPFDYVESGKFYVAVTATRGGANSRDTVYEYQRSDDGLSATRVKTLVQLEASEGNHNGGNLQFGPDGLLYFGTGDGGGRCNKNSHEGDAQDPTSQFGKILRLDPSAAPPYAARGNPFSGQSGDPTVLHYGLRNPFRFGFDRATGDLYVGDVGQERSEEIDFAPAGSLGLNFGWPEYEGKRADTCAAETKVTLRTGATHTEPIVDVDRQPGATGPFADYVSIISGTVYRGAALPQLTGVYLFGDYVGSRLGALRQCGQQTSEITVISKLRDPNKPGQQSIALPAGATFESLTAIVEDAAGELYFVVNRSTLWKLVPAST